MSERNRLAWLEQERGRPAAIAFAQTTKAVYEESIAKDGKEGRKFHHASLPKYRPLFDESIAAFADYLAAAGIKPGRPTF